MPKSTRGSFAPRRRRRKLKPGAVAIWATLIVLIGVGIALAVGSGKSPPRPAARSYALPLLAPDRCPLSDLVASGGLPPARQPLAVKIGNEPGNPGARPQSGLNEADLIIDTPVEGGLQRYIAVFQCNEAASIGPIRSVRLDDFHILSVFAHVELAFVGGDSSNQQLARSTPWVDNANEFVHGGVYHNDPQRTPPDATYSATSALWSLFSPSAAPRPIFTYSTLPPKSARPASSLAINFSAGTDVVWKWDAAISQWVHTYGGVPDVDALTGQPVTTTNIVVQVVAWHHGDDVDHDGNRDILATVIGAGKGYIFRNGVEVPVTWHRAGADAPTIYTDASGVRVNLAPGRTWVEMVLNTTFDTKGAFAIRP